MKGKTAKATLTQLFSKEERVDLHCSAMLEIVNNRTELQRQDKDAIWFHYLNFKSELFS